MITNRLSPSILFDIQQSIENHQIDRKKIELIYLTDDDRKNMGLSSELIRIQYVPENKYSISLYFKSWLLRNDHDNEHIQLYLPINGKSEQTDQSWRVIRCDLQEILIDPHYHINHERFFIESEPLTIAQTSSLSFPIYQLKGLNFLKQKNYCLSMIFGMPLFLISTTCQKYDPQSTKKNDIAFHTLINYLRENELILICHLDEDQLFSGHFILSVASEHCLIIRSIASSELLLPSPWTFVQQMIKSEGTNIDGDLMRSLSNIKIEDEEYNPLYYESRKSKITLSTNLI